MRRPTPRARVPLAVGLIVMLLAGLSAGSSTAVSATFTKATSPVAAAMSSGTLASPTGLTAVNGTCTILPSARQVNLSWSASASTFATGYVILRSTTSFVDSTPAASTTYFYVVRATRNNWLSANSNEASIATPTVLCV